MHLYYNDTMIVSDDLQVFKTYKLKLYPNNEQEIL